MTRNANVPNLCQRLLMGRDILHDDAVQVVTHRAQADMQALDVAMQDYDPSRSGAKAGQGWLPFVFAKPHCDRERVTIHALHTLDPQGQPTGELWLKLKRPEALAEAWNLATKPEAHDGPSLLSALRDILGASRPLSMAADHELQEGPRWLQTPLLLQQSPLRCPRLTTPLNVAPRFAGMFYIKLPTAQWLMADG